MTSCVVYFKLESVETIANHIMALYGAKVLFISASPVGIPLKAILLVDLCVHQE